MRGYRNAGYGGMGYGQHGGMGYGQHRGMGYGRGFEFDPERMFRWHGGLKYYILWLISERPMNGAEIMREIESESRGLWRPGPGSIYPALSTIVREGLAIRESGGNYRITEEGRRVLGVMAPEGYADTHDINSVLSELDSQTSLLEDVSHQVGKDPKRLRSIIEKLQKILDGWE